MEILNIEKNNLKKKNYKTIYCGNCGKKGHTYKFCKEPVISLGIVSYKIENGIIKYLLIRRKDTIGYVEFMRGKYSLNDIDYIKNLFSEMTKNEIYNINEYSFDILWNKLWLDQKSKQYKNEYLKSKDKFNKIKNKGILDNIIKNIKYFWHETEWGFPKGRRNLRETDIKCAKREFYEETCIKEDNITIITNIKPIEEIFLGSNGVKYKHIYYIANCNNKIDVKIDTNNLQQKSEVSNIAWFSYEKALNIIRPYHQEKKKVLKVINSIIKQYLLNIDRINNEILNLNNNVDSKYIMLI